MEEPFTKIPNDVLDALVRYRLPGEQMQILLLIIRKTIGFHKVTDAISITQFENTTGLARKSVTRAISGLCDKKIIIREASTRHRGNNAPATASEYRFNGRFDQWVGSVKKAPGRGEIAPKVGAFSRNTKETIQNKKITITQNTEIPHHDEGVKEEFYFTKKRRKLAGKRLESFERFWTAFNYKKDRANAADAWMDLNPSMELVEKICKAAAEEAAKRPGIVAKGRTPIYAQGWLSAKRWEDEDISGTSSPSIPIIHLTPEEQKAEFLS